MSLRGMGLKGQQRRHVLVTDVTDVTDDVMRSAVRGESQRGYASGTPRPRQRTIAYLGTLPHEGASARERAQFWERLLPRLDRLRLEPAAYEHLMEQLVAVVPPPTRSKLAAADRDGAARAAKHAFVAHGCVHRSPAERVRYPGSPTPRMCANWRYDRCPVPSLYSVSGLGAA